MKAPSFPLVTDDDLYLFHEGSHFQIQDKLGAHPATWGGEQGVAFAVWAPNARYVSVIGDFNRWNKMAHPMSRRNEAGVWETFVPGIGKGAAYKFHIESKFGGYRVDKSDPFGRYFEAPPGCASIVWPLDYRWGDSEWMAGRARAQADDRPISIYELHLGSWMRRLDDGSHLSYRDLAPRLIEHVRHTGFTHVQFLPVFEHPFYGTWGYGTTGYFAATRRYGPPEDLMFLIDRLHQAGVGVILDWVPAHFPADEFALAFFDGTWLFEHADPRKGEHPDWNTKIFNYGRPEVRSFLISSARYWLEVFHADGLRVDAVASMLYLDYSRGEGEWVQNEYGGRENLEAIDFLRRLNDEIRRSLPGVHMIAEESTTWPKVSHPTREGGLGFTMKWDMGWMHDTLEYLQTDPLFRKGRHDAITFRQMYAHSERFVLPLSHDEVVHGKRSLLRKMPGDRWQRFANLRLLLSWMFAQSGKKLLFMGGEIGQEREWDHESAIDFHLLDDPAHRGVLDLVADLNRLYRESEAMHARDFDPRGFEWIDCDDRERSVVSLLRRGEGDEVVAAAFNFTPVPRDGYRIGVPSSGDWTVAIDTDREAYFGSGYRKQELLRAEAERCHGRPMSVRLDLPPLAAVFLRGEVSRAPETGSGASKESDTYPAASMEVQPEADRGA